VVVVALLVVALLLVVRQLGVIQMLLGVEVRRMLGVVQ
jgi:hypothetical protein